MPLEKVTIARWQSRGGKYWVELYAEYLTADRSLEPGYSYRSDDGGGYIGSVDEGTALLHCKRIASYCPSQMRQVEVSL